MDGQIGHGHQAQVLSKASNRSEEEAIHLDWLSGKRVIVTGTGGFFW